MGAGIIPPVLDLDLVDEVVAVHSDEVYALRSFWGTRLSRGRRVTVERGAT